MHTNFNGVLIVQHQNDARRGADPDALLNRLHGGHFQAGVLVVANDVLR